MYVRAPATPPSLAQPSQVRYILFRHPGYDDACNVLLKLFAPDVSSGIGLHAGYALTACGVVAGNRWDGWLSEHKQGHGDGDKSARITFCAADRDKMLDKHSYYFHLPYDNKNVNDNDKENENVNDIENENDSEDDNGNENDNENDNANDNNTCSPYPIVPTFQEWPFPHDQLPPSWTQTASLELFEPQTYSVSGLEIALRQRDVTCRITGYREGLETAYMCPQAEEYWYSRNSMSRYNSGNSQSVDNPANALLLRADLHTAFDKPSFVFVPNPRMPLNPRMPNCNSLSSTCSSHLGNLNPCIITERCKA